MNGSNYNAIAAILAGDLATCTTERERTKVTGIAYSLADYFARENPRFVRDRFYAAVGIGQRYWLGEGVPIPPESVPGYQSTNEEKKSVLDVVLGLSNTNGGRYEEYEWALVDVLVEMKGIDREQAFHVVEMARNLPELPTHQRYSGDLR